MAFHVACPITCRKICFCAHGTPAPLLAPGGKESFLQDVMDLEKLLANPCLMASGGEEMVEILVPRLAKDLKSKKTKNNTGGESGEDTPFSLSKKAVMRKKATMAAIAVAEAAALAEQAKKVAEAARLGAARHLTETGAAPNGISGGLTCEICFFSEVTGSRKADRMIPCPSCKKMFHRNCLKRWAGDRDLFNWSSWVCASCRVCEVCRRTGEPNKLMFCKRCDVGLHVYCQQPPLKHVSKGPYLCPKHAICHSCSSRVPGSGVSSRWFLEHTFCDACGRLFMKGKYCTVCLKVYRDSEASPMVCCDNCEHWVHSHCDGISDEKYQEFQLDNNLHYTCPACRGECHKIKDVDDAIREIWRRRDERDKDLILQCQIAAGLPPKDENLRLCPSDDDQITESRPIKKTIKMLAPAVKEHDEKLFKKAEYGKQKMDVPDKSGTGGGVIKKLKITLPKLNMNMSKGQENETKDIGDIEERGHENMNKKKNNSVAKLTKYMIQARESIATSNGKKITFADRNNNNSGIKSSEPSFAFDENKDMLSRMKPSSEAKRAYDNPVKTVKFINSANKNQTGTKKTVMKIRPFVGAKEPQRQPDPLHLDEGSEDTSGSREGGSGLRSTYHDGSAQAFKVRGDLGWHSTLSVKYRDKNTGIAKAKRSYEERYDDDHHQGLDSSNDTSSDPEREFSAKLSGNNNGGGSGTFRGPRSKRRKHSALNVRKMLPNNESELESDPKESDDNWVLQKLGRAAVGKRVEVFRPRDRSWYKGRVTEVLLKQSEFTVSFEDGLRETLKFGKRNVRVLSHLGKHPRS